MTHPFQIIERDPHGITRFRRNQIVEKLLDDGPFDMNDIDGWNVPREDRVQFAQLIGYSVSGFGELSYNSPDEVARADRLADLLALGTTTDHADPRDRKIADLEARIASLRDAAWSFYCNLGGNE